ncbi:MAG TPA: glutathione S-transferase [Myxococcales bacterium]|nr:glutathione S-transferase [Myxococcales bacterium]
MLELSPKGTVPVLLLQDGTVLEESLDIMLWTLDRNDPEKWLPENDSERQEMVDLIAENDGDFKTHLDRYKYANRYEGVDAIEHRDQAEHFLAALEKRLNNNPFLFGDRITLADIAIYPFIRQFANTDRAWFDAAPCPALQAWLDARLDSELFKRSMKKFSVWQPSTVGIVFPDA